MRYFSSYVPDPKTNPLGRPAGAKKEAMDKFVADALARGELVSGGGFLPLKTHGCIVRQTNGKSQVVDGPYVESKELIGGFAMLEYASREAAIEGAKRFLEVAGDGECVTYAIADESDCHEEQQAA